MKKAFISSPEDVINKKQEAGRGKEMWRSDGEGDGEGWWTGRTRRAMSAQPRSVCVAAAGASSAIASSPPPPARLLAPSFLCAWAVISI